MTPRLRPSPGRLAAPFGRLIDRNQVIRFTFEGGTYQGFAGDTVASALWANGVRVLSRSFKYHRPRGMMSACGQEANTLVRVDDEPNALADKVAIEPGMSVRAQNYFGSLQRDRAALLDRLGRFLPVGFYYKAFFKPKGAWPMWERIIRRVAGLGHVDLNTQHNYYDKAYLFYDVAVIGGGPAGMAAAAAAARSGAEVLLVEEMPDLGGSLSYARFDSGGERADEARQDLLGAVEAQTSLDVMTEAVCTAIYTDNWLAITKRNRLYKLRARAIVVAAGSYEQPMVFRNNDLPGVMLGSGVQRLIKLYAVKPGERAVVVTAGGDGYGVALDLLDAGVEVACIAELRPEPEPCPRAQAARRRGASVIEGSTVWEALPAPGLKGVKGAILAPITGAGVCGEPTDRIACDLIVSATGYSPVANLIHHAGGELTYDEESAMFSLRRLPPHLFAAGSVGGVYDLEAAVADGRLQGWMAARDAGFDAGPRPPEPGANGAAGQSHPWPMFPHPEGRDFLDFDEDLEVKDILDTIAEGYDGIELVKRFSTVGMGPSQGRHSAVAAARLVARATGIGVGAVGASTSRPPFRPEKFGVLAGRGFEPVRHTSIHRRHLEAGAKMMTAGLWLRPEYYGPGERRRAAILDEALNLRRNVGLIDVSTLGGLEVRGADAAEFLERMYTFAYAKQPVGRARYVLMTDLSGVIADDGVAARLREHRFYVTATTSGVDAVYQSMLWHNAQWGLDVDVTNVTTAYAAVNIAGPKSRRVLAKICRDVDLGPEAYPYMGVREGHVAGIPALLMRVGFVGELGYEIHVSADHGEALWDALMAAGREEGIRPFGVEAQRLLRLEKGHIIVGQDTDGLTTPHEADMAWAISRKKPYFVGKRSVEIQQQAGLTRKLVGFAVPDPDAPVPEECHLVIRDGEITGRVTSCSFSPALDKVIGLAFVAPDQADLGHGFDIKAGGGRMVRAEVVPLPFYDPDNQRQEL